MKTTIRTVLPAAAAILLLALPAGGAESARLPVMAGQQAVASVNGEPVTVEDLFRQIGSLHSGVSEPAVKVQKPDPSALLQRIINARLIVQEARRIGLEQLPDVKDRVETYRLGLLKSGLIQKQMTDITAPDPARVDRIYRDATRQVRIDSLIFGKEEDAREFAATAGSGADFDAIAGGAIAAGKARGGQGAQLMKASELLPEIAGIIAAMKPGTVSGPVRLSDGFAVVKVFEVRYPEDAAARRRAEQAALQNRKDARLKEYQDSLKRRYAQVNRPVLDGLDYEAKEPGLAKLRGDDRILAQIKGDQPIRVRDLTGRVEGKFYHGVEEAIQRKRVNLELPLLFENLLMERLVLREAGRLKIENTDSFKSGLRERTDGLLFETFVTKVINPEIKLTEAEVRKYYDEHLDEYTNPEMMRIESLAFGRKEDAQAALARLRRGADLKWMRANADGQADPEKNDALLEFTGSLLTTATLPDRIREAVAGAAAGDVRLAGDAQGPFYVLAVRQVVAATPMPYEKAKSEVGGKVFERKRRAALDDWTTRLRAASDIKVYAGESDLRRILGLKSTEGT